MKNTVESYNSDEALEKGIGEEIKKKGVFRSIILPLFLSLIAAIGIWAYVATENSLVSGLTLQINGKETLQTAGYTVTTVDPQNVDVVLNGKAELTSKVVKDRSRITARINLFKDDVHNDEKNKEYYVFENVDDIRDGTYTVQIEFILPDGVTCEPKTVSVVISKSEQAKN